MHKKIMAEDASWEAMATKLGVTLKAEDKKLKGKALVKRVMQSWLPAGDAIATMIATHAPNPKVAQKLKIEHIYKGDMESDTAKAMVACDPNGPLMMHVVKMTPTGSAGRFYAVGRIFSGVASTDKYHIRGPDYDPEDPETSAYAQEGRAQNVMLNLGKVFNSNENFLLLRSQGTIFGHFHGDRIIRTPCSRVALVLLGHLYSVEYIMWNEHEEGDELYRRCNC